MRHLVCLLFLLASPAFAGLIGGLDPQDVPAVNKLENGGFENGLARWDASGTSVLSSVTSGANLLVGSRTASWDAGASSETLDSSQVAIDAGHGNDTCIASFVYKGGDSNISAQVWDGASVLASYDLTSVTASTPVKFVFACPTSGTIGFRLSAAADAAIIYIDDVYVGVKTSETTITNPIVYEETNTVTGFGGTTGTITHNKNIPIDKQDWIGVVTTGSANLQLDPSTFITDKTVNSINYDFTGLAGTDTVTVKMKDTSFSSQIVSPVTYDSGKLSSAPTFPLNHGLPGRPQHVVVLTEGQSLAGKWDQRIDLCSADSTVLDCDLSALTIDGSHRVQIIASMSPAGTAITCADGTVLRNGLLCNSSQTVGGEKTYTAKQTISMTGDIKLELDDNGGGADTYQLQSFPSGMRLNNSTNSTSILEYNDTTNSVTFPGPVSGSKWNGLGFQAVRVGTDCTADPCSSTAAGDVGVTSVNRTGTGVYLINFASSWSSSSKFVCTVNNYRGDSRYCVGSAGNSASNWNVLCFSSSGNPIDTRFVATCIGELP